MNVYFISGLGVDKRVFKKLTLLPQFSIHHIDWIKPLAKESLQHYTKRLCSSIDKTVPFALIGLSFGGMVATEMNQFVQPVKTIIISSAAKQSELPWFIRAIRFAPLYKILPGWLMKTPNPLFHYLFSIRTSEEKILLKQILHDTDTILLKWSIDAITNWKNENIPPGLIHIHGNADKLLPIKYVKADVAVEDGGHFMIYSKAGEISAIINAHLSQSQL